MPPPKAFVRPTEGWSAYQARLLRLMEEAGLHPSESAHSPQEGDDSAVASAGQSASGRP